MYYRVFVLNDCCWGGIVNNKKVVEMSIVYDANFVENPVI